MTNRAELEEELKGLHHASKRAKEIKRLLEDQGEVESAPDKVAQEEVATVAEIPSVQTEKSVEKVMSTESQGFKVNPRKTYTFKSKNKGRWILPNISRVWDEKEQAIREIRYNRLSNSPFLDEQDESLSEDREAIIFNHGVLHVSGRNKALVEYIMQFDGIFGKPHVLPENMYLRNTIQLNDPEVMLEKQAELEDLILEAKIIISKAAKTNVSALEDFLRSEFQYHKENPSDNELKVFANSQADVNPKAFINDFDNPKHKIKSDVLRGLEKGVFTIEDGNIKVLSTGMVVFKIGPKDKFEESLTNWILSDDPDAKSFKKLVDKSI